MEKHDPRIDAYIAKSEDFAKPILHHLRKLVHAACPEVEETMKWSFPHFGYKGMLCSMASFKQHCAFGFWKAALLSDSQKLLSSVGDTAMDHFGRITSLADLPPDKIIMAYVKEAVKLNDEGVKLPTKTKSGEKKKLTVPAYFNAALNNNKKALQTFEAFSPTNKREYVEWLTEAKSDETRKRRLETAIEWMAEGKVRNWKYVKKS